MLSFQNQKTKLLALTCTLAEGVPCTNPKENNRKQEGKTKLEKKFQATLLFL